MPLPLYVVRPLGVAGPSTLERSRSQATASFVQAVWYWAYGQEAKADELILEALLHAPVYPIGV